MSEINMHEPASLAEAIIPLDMAPTIPEPPEGEGILVDILADRTLARDGKLLTMRPDVLVLNGLLLLRDQGWVSGNQIRDRVGFPYGLAALSNRMTALRKGLTEITGNERALESSGTGTSRRHQLSPLLIFKDRRIMSEDWAADAIALARGEFLDKDADKIVAWRRAALSSLFRTHRNDPQVRAVSDRLGARARHQRTENAELAPDAITEHFDRIEKGLQTFIDLKQKPEHVQTGIDATISYHTLLLSALPLARIKAVKYARSYDTQLTDDLWNICMEEVTEVIMNRGAYGAAENFYGLCVTAMSGRMSEVVGNEDAFRHCVVQNEITLRSQLIDTLHALDRKLQRPPTLGEVQAALPGQIRSKYVTVKGLEAAFYRLRHPTLRLDGCEDWLRERILTERTEGLDEEDYRLDQQLNEVLFQEVTESIFSSPELTDMEKIVLSLHSGIFSPSLCGAEITHLQKKITFTYPYDEESFDELVRPLANSGEGIGNLLSYTRTRINTLLREVRKKAAKIAEESWDYNSDEAW